MKTKSYAFRAGVGATLAALLAIPVLALALTITPPLCEGASGPTVTALQQFLKEAGFFSYPTVTGYYGPYTRSGVAALQHDIGLPQTGCIDGQTAAFLNSLASTGALSGGALPTPTFDFVANWNSYAPPGYDPGYGGGYYVPPQPGGGDPGPPPGPML
jgi:peptidoglycan hydrolase-like protein with peptidoglycan-binding domain